MKTEYIPSISQREENLSKIIIYYTYTFIIILKDFYQMIFNIFKKIFSRYCGDAFRREIQPNRVCKNNGSRGSGFKGRSSKRDTNKQIESCGRSGQDDTGSSSNYGSDFSYASSGSSFGGGSFGARFSGRVSESLLCNNKKSIWILNFFNWFLNQKAQFLKV